MSVDNQTRTTSRALNGGVASLSGSHERHVILSMYDTTTAASALLALTAQQGHGMNRPTCAEGFATFVPLGWSLGQSLERPLGAVDMPARFAWQLDRTLLRTKEEGGP